LEQTFQDLNLIFCELASLLVLASETKSNNFVHTKRERPRKTGRQNLTATLPIQTERVSEYVVQLLRGGPVSSSQISLPLSSTAYIGLLPTIWSLLNNRTIDRYQLSSDVLLATIEHAVKTPSRSGLKKSTVEFVARIILVGGSFRCTFFFFANVYSATQLETERHYQGRFTVGRSDVERRAFEEWIIHLPQTLWELGSNNLPAAEVRVLDFPLAENRFLKDLIR
jgi:pre-rRNA-processing protein IPI1